MARENEEPEDETCCCHEVVHKDKSIWIKPARNQDVHSPVLRRPYCKKCGRIKYMGSSPAKKMGFYINLLKEIQKKLDIMHKRQITRHKLTNVQMRLIIKDLKNDIDFQDRFSNYRSSQLTFFKETLRKYCPVDEEIIDSVYQDFKG